MGPAEVAKPDPERFLKKHEREPILPESEFLRGSEQHVVTNRGLLWGHSVVQIYHLIWKFVSPFKPISWSEGDEWVV